MSENIIDSKAMFKIGYGLYVLTTREDLKDNGCIINTAGQLTEDPARIQISVNKKNLTHDMVLHTEQFNLCCFSTDAEYALFRRFGFQSGRKADKFAGLSCLERSENGIYLLTQGINAILCARVTETVDLDDHTLVIAEVTENRVVSQVPSCTFDYYQTNICPG